MPKNVESKVFNDFEWLVYKIEITERKKLMLNEIGLFRYIIRRQIYIFRCFLVYVILCERIMTDHAYLGITCN